MLLQALRTVLIFSNAISLIDGEDEVSAHSHCSAHERCKGLGGNCCPNDAGERLDCCPPAPTITATNTPATATTTATSKMQVSPASNMPVIANCSSSGYNITTGGSCYFTGCQSWSNAVCNNESTKLCVCAPGSCSADKAICVADGDCSKDTGGSCGKIFKRCEKASKATCTNHWYESGRCMCASNQCAVDGRCVNKTNQPTELDSLAETYAMRDDDTVLSTLPRPSPASAILLFLTLLSAAAIAASSSSLASAVSVFSERRFRHVGSGNDPFLAVE